MKTADIRRRRNLLAWLYVLIAFLFYFLDGTPAHVNETLLFVLNTVFTGILPLIVAVMAGYSYRHNKSLSILFMSCGMLVFGAGSILTGLIRLTPGTENASVAVYDFCIFFSAACHFAAAVKVIRRRSYNAAVMRLLPPFSYLFTLMFVIGVFAAARFELLPPFIDQNGGTRLRSIVLWLSATCFLASFLELSGQFAHQKRDYLFWYSHSLLLMAVGLVIVFLSTGIGTLTGWIGRGTHYIGAVFALHAMVCVGREARRNGRSLAFVMEDFFIDEGSGYKSLAAESSSAMFITDKSFNIRFVNASAAAMLGCSREELLHTSFLDLFPEPYKDQIVMGFEEHVSTGLDHGSNALRLSIAGRQGKVCSADMVATYHITYAGVVCTYILQDITEREHAYKEIEQKNAALRTINQVCEVAIHGTDAGGFADKCLEIILHATDGSCGLLGAVGGDGALKVLTAKHNRPDGCCVGAGAPIPFPEGQCNFLDFCNAVVHDRKPGLMHPPLALGARGGGRSGHLPGISYLGVPILKGSNVVCLVSLRSDRRKFLPEDQRMLEELIPTVYEILQKEQAEAALRVSNSLVRAILDGTPDPVFLKDVQGRFQLGNKALSQVLGVPLEDLLGRTCLDVYTDKEKARNVMKNDRRVLASGKAQTFEEVIPAVTGIRTYLSNKSLWINEHGAARGIIGIAQDITDRKSMELELKKQSIDLELKNKLITDFFINISHEFKTPLSVIVLVSDLLEHEIGQQEVSLENVARFVRILRVNAFRLRRLVANLLDITKLDAGFMQPRWENADVVCMLQNLVASTAVFAKKKELSLGFHSAVGELDMATDSLMLERIVLNLLSNAIKYTKKGGAIRVSLCMLEDKLSISVKDNGEGIPPDRQEIIFDRFRQVNTSLTRSSEGCGIGLSITKSLVELLGGTIAFESELGMGSTFCVFLPVTRNESNTKLEQDGTELNSRIQLELSDISFD